MQFLPCMNKRLQKKRLDILLTERGLAESRQKAQALILAGEVTVNGQKADKAGTNVSEDARVELLSAGIRYVSRGGLKLEGALADLGISVNGRICADVGSSTGGFTEVLQQHIDTVTRMKYLFETAGKAYVETEDENARAFTAIPGGR